MRATNLTGLNGVESFPAGAHGGAVQCTTLSVASTGEDVCFWTDSHTVGYLFAIDTQLKPVDLAAIVNTARNTLDH